MMDSLDAVTLPMLARTVLAVLFDLTLKGVLILALAGLLTSLLHKASASTRHLVWGLALCSVLVLPVLTVTLPAWHLPLLDEVPYLQEVTAPLHGSDTPAARLASASGDVAVSTTSTPVAPTASGATATSPEGEGVAAVVSHEALDAVVGPLLQRFEAARAVPWSVWLLWIWIGGVATVLFRFALGAAGVVWLARRARPIRDPAWTRLAREIQGHLGLRRRVRLLRSVRTAMPMTWGLLRPVILLPLRADEWSEARRRCVLTHELAHVRRWDCLTQTLAQLACALNWFNPLAWLAARQMRHERELACDDYVLHGAIRPSDYAAHLLAIARTTRTTLVVPLGAVGMARPSQLEGRVRSILDATRRRGTLNRLATGSIMGLAGIMVLPLAAMRPATPDAPLRTGTLALQQVITPQGEAYRWAGPLEPGRTLAIRGLRGHVQATPSAGTTVEVRALPRDDAFTGAVRVVEQEGSVVICLPDPADTDACAPDTAPATAPADHGVVDFVALIPHGVHFSGHSLHGNVTVVGVQSDVKAVTVDGDIYVKAGGRVSAHAVAGDITVNTTSYARARTRTGNIHARLGRTDWAGHLPFESEAGDITVELPGRADTDIDLHVEASGRLRSVIRMQRQAQERGERFRGTLGQGGRLLAIHTRDGNITITHRGAQPFEPLEEQEVRRQDSPRWPDRPRYRAEAQPVPESPRLEHLREHVNRLDVAVSDAVIEAAEQAIEALDDEAAFTLRDLTELAQLADGKSSRYARQLKRLGVGDFTPGELLLARLVGVNAVYVQSVQVAGYSPSLKELVAMKAAGVDKAYIDDMAEEGYEALPVKALVELRKSGVDREVIHVMEEQGIHAPTVEEMVEFQTSRGPVPH